MAFLVRLPDTGKAAAVRDFHAGARGYGGAVAKYGKGSARYAPHLSVGLAVQEVVKVGARNANVGNAADYGGAWLGARVGSAIEACARSSWNTCGRICQCRLCTRVGELRGKYCSGRACRGLREVLRALAPFDI